jgi:hydroxymethylglutaryl-CoA reductase
VSDRFDIVNDRLKNKLDRVALQSGGLNSELADTMIENVIGKLSLPLAVVPQMVINNKNYMVPMCIE